MYNVPLAFQCTYGCSDEGGENGDEEEGREYRLPVLLYADDLALCGVLEDNLREEGLVKWDAIRTCVRI